MGSDCVNSALHRAISCKITKKSKVEHILYTRRHQVREKVPEKPPDRTMFVASIPPFFTKNTLQEIFSKFGEITEIYLHKTPSPKVPAEDSSAFFKTHQPLTGYLVAYVVYKGIQAIDKVLRHEKSIILNPDTLCSGLSKWVAEYNSSIADTDAMSKEIEDFMLSYDESDARKQTEEKMATSEDNDGWVTVTKKGRRPGFSRKESVKIQLEKTDEIKRKKREHNNFYRFQIKESKMKHLVTLRQKFEEDKKKIAALKASRRFKPF